MRKEEGDELGWVARCMWFDANIPYTSYSQVRCVQHCVLKLLKDGFELRNVRKVNGISMTQE